MRAAAEERGGMVAAGETLSVVWWPTVFLLGTVIRMLFDASLDSSSSHLVSALQIAWLWVLLSLAVAMVLHHALHGTVDPATGRLRVYFDSTVFLLPCIFFQSALEYSMTILSPDNRLTLPTVMEALLVVFFVTVMFLVHLRT
jgi:hypothetical protein